MRAVAGGRGGKLREELNTCSGQDPLVSPLRDSQSSASGPENNWCTVPSAEGNTVDSQSAIASYGWGEHS